ncbi:MAG: hypothetical protein ACM3PC_14610, partial [Deltaproteobacteria bacterium]
MKVIVMNKSTGITHPNDKGRAIETFQRLKAAKESFDPAEIEAWVVTNEGWTPENAAKLGRLAADILAGKNPRSTTKGPFWKDDVIEHWRAKAAGARNPGTGSAD